MLPRPIVSCRRGHDLHLDLDCFPDLDLVPFLALDLHPSTGDLDLGLASFLALDLDLNSGDLDHDGDLELKADPDLDGLLPGS